MADPLALPLTDIHMRIEALPGLGEALVSGTVTPVAPRGEPGVE